MFNIAATQFNIASHEYEIYISGCKGVCKGCHNPHLWDPSVGKPWGQFQDKIREAVNSAGPLVSSIRIYGGEPLEKPLYDLRTFILWLRHEFKDKEIWLFTRFPFEEVPKEIIEVIDYIKCGPYDETQLGENIQYGVKLATLNQKIYKKGVDF